MTDRGLSGCTREPSGVLGQMGLGGDEGMQSRSGVGGPTGRGGDLVDGSLDGSLFPS